MIQANEVRLGNWIFDPRHKGGSFCKIQMGDFANAEEDREDFFDYEPIHLTPEILEKAGFYSDVQFDGIFIEKYHVSINCHFELVHFDDDTFIFHTIAPNLYLKYLHELQNLYFALTGEELQIEL